MKIEPKYVTYEQAKWLKEKGLDYHKIFEDFSIYYDYNVTGEYHRRHYSDFSESVFPNDLWIPIPEQHQVVEWLRVNHDIWVCVDYSIDDNYFIYGIRTRKIDTFDDDFKTPQEAYSAAFDYIKDNNLI